MKFPLLYNGIRENIKNLGKYYKVRGIGTFVIFSAIKFSS
jgi:hypothetical protein